MAGIFYDSFDHYATADLAQKWTQINGSPTVIAGGRHGTNGIHFDSYLNGDDVRVTPYPVPTGPTCIVGFAFKAASFAAAGIGGGEDSGSIPGSTTIVSIRMNGTTQMRLTLLPDGTLWPLRASTSIGPASGFALTQNVYQYIEFKVFLHATLGTVTIRVNGLTIYSLTGQNTMGAGVATWNEIKLGKFQVTADIDDIYVLDGDGSNNNDFLGDVRVDVIYPNAAGSSAQFTRFPVTELNQWATIDETAPNGDTDYNESATPLQRDSMNFPNAPVTGARIYAVQALAYVKKTDSGAAGLKLATRMSGTYYDGADLSVGTQYNYQRQIWDRRPTDNGIWLDTDIDAAEFGYLKST